jgi:hypothetical protein
MESSLSSAAAQQQVIKQTPSENSSLKVDFSWKKFKVLISKEDDPQSKMVYLVDCNLSKPHLLFKSAPNDAVFGKSNLHAISIDADCEISGQPVTLKAMKRFKTEYSHLSHAFSDTDKPVRMTWTSSSDFKTWDFICLDEQQNPVAKYSANVWAVKKVGRIEFLGPKATNEAARQEIVIVGFTLFYLMLLRMNSLLSFFGAIFSKPGYDDKEGSDGAAKQAAENDKTK